MNDLKGRRPSLAARRREIIVEGEFCKCIFDFFFIFKRRTQIFKKKFLPPIENHVCNSIFFKKKFTDNNLCLRLT